jgi:hypothetical protein
LPPLDETPQEQLWPAGGPWHQDVANRSPR